MSEEEPKRKLKRPPMPGAGRPLGALNKFTKDLKTAMLDAAMLSDFAKDPNDEDAPGSLTQYCLTMVHKFPELYFQALMRLVPREINTHLQQDIDVTVYRSVDEVKNAMLDAGMSSNTITAIQAMLPVPIIEKETPVDEGDDVADILFDERYNEAEQ
jgi:hypothetical protein